MSPLARRALIAVGGTSFIAALVLVGAGRAVALDGPEAVVLDARTGEVVVSIDDRSSAPEALETAFARHAGTPLRLEFVYRSHGSIATPVNDPMASQQWALSVLGMEDAWTMATGEGVVVAILDSPVNFGGTDGLCATVVHPYDATTLTPGVSALNLSSGFGHGTHVAGTVAQCTNNGIGVVGIAPGVSLMPVQVLDDDGDGTSGTVALGIDWAVEHGAQIINLSLGGTCTEAWPACGDVLVDAAIARAVERDVILIASSGNLASPFVAYPAAHPSVIAVGASTASDALWNPSATLGTNTGPDLDLVAPGSAILQETTSYGVFTYGQGFGTSMAAPHVTAAAALILDTNPHLDRNEVASILMATARDRGVPGFDMTFGNGRLDIAAAVAEAHSLAIGPCPSGHTCDAVARIDNGGLWGLWDAIDASPSVSLFFFGNPGDVPFMGDWDGDGVATPGLYRQSDGFVYVRNSNTEGVADVEFFFGDPGDVPLVGDFDGDGRDSVSIWRASEARVYVINELGADGAGLGAADYSFLFGNPGDAPFVGDFDGDGVDSVGLYRESTGFVYFRNANTTGGADLSFFFGDPGDRILAGDWDGDGDDTVAVYRPSTGRLYVSLENAAGKADWTGTIGSYPHVITAGR